MLPSAKSGISGELLMAYVAIAIKHLRLMCLLVALGLLLGLTYYTFARPVYYAKSLISVERLDRPMDRSVGADTVFIDSNDRTLIQEFASDYMIKRTAGRFGVDASRKEIDLYHLKKIAVNFNAQGNLVVEVWPYSVAWARDWADVMVEEYLAYRDEKRLEQRELAVKSFSREIDQISMKMQEAFNQKYDFKDASDMDKLLIEFQELNQVPKDLLAVNRKLSTMKQTRETLASADFDTVTKLSLLSFIDQTNAQQNLQIAVGQMLPGAEQGPDAAPDVVVPAMVTPNFLPWQDLEKKQRTLLVEMERLGTTYLPGHPKMQDLQKQLETVNQALDVELDVLAQRFDLEYRSLQRRKTELESRLSEVQEVTRRHQHHLQEFARFDAGQLAWSSIHNQMTKHISALDFWADKERVQLQFMGQLEFRDDAVSPAKLKLALASLAFGLGLAVSIPFLLEYLNTSISDPNQAELDLNIASLGLIPQIAPSAANAAESQEKDLEEHFRIIRTNMLLTSSSQQIPQVILVTSSLPAEGKTTVSQNMAKSFALRGEKTLLIDADLRRGRQHKLFGVPARPGLRGILESGASPTESCVNIHPNLDLLPCGPYTGDASELIDSDVFIKMLSAYRAHYTRIVIDSPPALGLAEAAILQRHADGVMMVIWSEFTPLHAVRDAVRSLKANGANITGFVLNRVDFQSVYYQYRYFYYSPNYYSKYALPADAAAG